MLAQVNAPVSADAASGWAARLELDIESRGQRAVLVRRSHTGPLYVQKPLYPEGPETVHLYLLHPPGGVVGGDRLDVRVRVAAGAGALLTTPAAQKLYRSAGAQSRLTTTLSLARDTSVEWLPSETIVFDGAVARQRTRVEFEAGAALIGWEITCFGRPASGIRFARGRVELGLDLVREKTPLLVERVAVEGGSTALDEAWGFSGMPVAGTLYAVPRLTAEVPALVRALRSLETVAGTVHAVTSIGDALVVRALGEKLEPLRRLMIAHWAALRPSVVGRAAVSPRIWAT
jgi:urease accessory protein